VGNDDDVPTSVWLSPLQDVIIWGKQGETILSPHAVAQNVLVQNGSFSQLQEAMNSVLKRMQQMELELDRLSRFVAHAETMQPGILEGWMIVEAARKRLKLDEENGVD